MKINICLVNFMLTGGNCAIRELAKRLAEKGHNVIITAIDIDTSWCHDIINNPNISFNKVGAYGKYPSFLHIASGLFNMLFHMPESDVDIATYCLTAYPVWLGGKGVKKFYFIQHYESLFFNNFLFKWIADMTYKLPFINISNTNWTKDTIEKNTGAKIDKVIHTGYNLETVNTTKYILGKKKGKNRILCLGKDYVDWKGVQDLFKAMDIVNAKRDDIDLVFYGIKSMTTYNKKVPYSFVCNPTNEELAYLYTTADVVISPSWYESLAAPIQESMKYGAPIVTTTGKEDIAVDGYNCLLVKPRDYKGMANAILRLLNDDKLRKKLIRNGKKTIKNYSWDLHAEGWNKEMTLDEAVDSWDKIWKNFKGPNLFGKIMNFNKGNTMKEIFDKWLCRDYSAIDIGLGSGESFNILKKFIPKTIGIDSSENSIKVASNHLGFKVNKDIFISDAFKWKGKYDLIFSEGLIEHFDEVVCDRLVKKFCRMSKRFILLYQPDNDTLFNVFKTTVLKMKRKHINEFYYNKDDYNKMFKKYGFKIVDSGNTNFGEIMWLLYEMIK